MSKIDLLENERIDDLQCKGLKIIQNKTLYNFSTDPILLVNFSEIKKDSVVVDFCSGSGIIGMLVAGKSQAKKVYCIELQENLAKMSQRSVELNDLQSKIEIINDSVQNISKYFCNQTVDVVFCNPPYSKINSSVVGQNPLIDICRHEITITLKDVIEQASNILKNKGVFYLVHQSNRLEEIVTEMNKKNIHIKKLCFVQSFEDEKPHLILIKGIKNSKIGTEILPNLVINNEDGSYSQQILKMYNKEVL